MFGPVLVTRQTLSELAQNLMRACENFLANLRDVVSTFFSSCSHVGRVRELNELSCKSRL